MVLISKFASACERPLLGQAAEVGEGKLAMGSHPARLSKTSALDLQLSAAQGADRDCNTVQCF